MRPPTKLVAVVADGTYDAVLRALFNRWEDAGFGPVTARIIIDPNHDSSRRLTELLRPFLTDYDHALVLRDLHGSGFEAEGAEKLEQSLEAQMGANGWRSKHCAAVVTNPEIEEWLRLPSPPVLELLQQRARKDRTKVREFRAVLTGLLRDHGGRDSRGKPLRPKEVFEALVRRYGIPPANALRGFLAQREPIEGCASDSFNRLLRFLRLWFPPV